MNIGLYQSAASLSALERWQDVVSQNITSSEATAYKKRTTYLTAEGNGEFLVGPNASIDNGEGLPAQFPVARSVINFQPGETHPTGRDLDLALQGDGFFEIQLPDGRKAYTRVGEFRMRADRTIVGINSSELLTESGTPLQLPPGQGKLSINQNGVVAQGGTQLGRLSIQKFDQPELLTPIATGVFVAPEGVEPVAVEKPEVLQGQLESSNLSSLHEMVDLVTISRAYEANQKMITSRDDLLAKVLQTFG